MSFQPFNYSENWSTYGKFMKNQFRDLFEKIEAYCKKAYPSVSGLGNKLDKLGDILWNHPVAKSSIYKKLIWSIRLICGQPLVANNDAYNKNRKKFAYYPNPEKAIPVLLKTFHSYQKIHPEIQIGQNYIFEIVNIEGKKLLDSRRQQIFDTNGVILNQEGYNEKIQRLETNNEFVYIMRILYQIRNSVTHAGKRDPNYRDVIFLIYQILPSMKLSDHYKKLYKSLFNHQIESTSQSISACCSLNFMCISLSKSRFMY